MDPTIWILISFPNLQTVIFNAVSPTAINQTSNVKRRADGFRIDFSTTGPTQKDTKTQSGQTVVILIKPSGPAQPGPFQFRLAPLLTRSVPPVPAFPLLCKYISHQKTSFPSCLKRNRAGKTEKKKNHK